jgi:hypothetical protein
MTNTENRLDLLPREIKDEISSYIMSYVMTCENYYLEAADRNTVLTFFRNHTLPCYALWDSETLERTSTKERLLWWETLHFDYPIIKHWIVCLKYKMVFDSVLKV